MPAFRWRLNQNRDASHSSTPSSAAVTSVCTRLAMIHVELAAFFSACFADIRTYSANFMNELRPPAHVAGRCPAYLGTVLVEPDALGHFGHISLTQAGIRAMFALLGTADAGIDTALMFFVTHSIPPNIRVTQTLPLWHLAAGIQGVPRCKPPSILHLEQLGNRPSDQEQSACFMPKFESPWYRRLRLPG